MDHIAGPRLAQESVIEAAPSDRRDIFRWPARLRQGSMRARSFLRHASTLPPSIFSTTDHYV